MFVRLAIGSLIAAIAFASGRTTVTAAAHDRSFVMNALDVDRDGGQLDLRDVTAAADAKFAQLDVDHDAKLDARELTGVMTHAELVAADADRDGVLNAADYRGYVKRMYAAADADRDGKLDAADLSSSSGVELVTLLHY